MCIMENMTSNDAKSKTKENEMNTNETTLKLDAELKRETERAFLMAVETDTQTGLSVCEIWFPKSRTELCEGGIEIEAWLYNAKASEMNSNFICFIELTSTLAAA